MSYVAEYITKIEFPADPTNKIMAKVAAMLDPGETMMVTFQSQNQWGSYHPLDLGYYVVEFSHPQNKENFDGIYVTFLT